MNRLELIILLDTFALLISIWWNFFTVHKKLTEQEFELKKIEDMISEVLRQNLRKEDK